MYFISPACPSAIHCGNRPSSRESAAGAIPARSKPASAAARLMNAFISPMGMLTSDSTNFKQDTLPPPRSSERKPPNGANHALTIIVTDRSCAGVMRRFGSFQQELTGLMDRHSKDHLTLNLLPGGETPGSCHRGGEPTRVVGLADRLTRA